MMNAVAIMALVALGLGCRPEPRSTTVHEPGVYKGAKDPLLGQQKQQELVDRLNLVQRDR
jgi:hypothetical protein